MLIIAISRTVEAKYTLQYEFDVANLNIDRTKPKIELLSITNSNKKDKKQADKSDSITIKIKIVDENLKDVFLDRKHINIKIDDKEIDDVNIKADKMENTKDGGIYQIELTKLDGNGVLKVCILEGTVVDTGELKSEMFEIDTNILICNNKDNINNIDIDNIINSNFIIPTH